MRFIKESLIISTRKKGLISLTEKVNQIIAQHQVSDGICHLFIPHTSASLLLSESFDPTAKSDLEAFMDKLVPENQPWYNHTLEGPDDSPSHMRSMLTSASESIPIDNGSLNLGTWQGIYLFEHRRAPHQRTVLLRILDGGGS
jgi:secondary thiamine-phosphate synthase enzyme